MPISRLAIFLCSLLLLGCEKDPPYTRVPDTPEETPPAYVQYGMPFATVPENADIVMYEVNLRALGVAACTG